MSFVIVTDTSANIPKRMVEERDLKVIPFSYYVDGVEHTCDDIEAFDGEGFYAMMKGHTDVTTSQIPPQRYADFFEPFVKEGQDVLFVSMSSGISGSFSSSNIAAVQLMETYPDRIVRSVDTKGASLGEGLLALRAAECRDKGMGIEETVELLCQMRERICQVFTVDDLMFLRKGGRISNVTAIVGTVLNIKPLLKGDEEGHIVAFGKVRGRKHSIEAIAERYDRLVKNPGEQTVCIANAACTEDAEYLIRLLNRNNPPREIMNVCYEPVTGSHVGPGALALFFEGDDGARLEIK